MAYIKKTLLIQKATAWHSYDVAFKAKRQAIDLFSFIFRQ